MRGNWIFKSIDRYVGIPLIFLLGFFAFPVSKKRGEYSKILLIKLSAMGDTILMIPAIRALRRRFPQATIKMVVTDINKEIVKRCPYLDGIIVLDLAGYIRKPWLFLSFINILRQEKFVAALDFDQWLRISPLLAFFSGAARRIGFKTPHQSRHQLYTDVIEHSREKHEVECFLDIVKPLGIENPDSALELWVDKNVQEEVEKKLAAAGLKKEDALIVVHPGCGAHGFPRQWPAKKYQELLRQLQTAAWPVKIVVTGGRSEKSIVEQVGQGLPLMKAVGWTLDEIVALISLAKVVVCGNTGVMHIAAALGTLVVALHGPTNPKKWGPWSKKSTPISAKISCSPCLYLGFEYACTTFPCMNTIEVNEVFNAVMNSLHGENHEK